MSSKIVQTAGRDQLGEFAPRFAHLNDDVLFGEVWNEEAVDVKTKCIVTVVSLMASGITDSSLTYHLQNAKAHGVTKLQSLIKDLVVLFRLDEMRELPMSDVDLSEVTAETAESFREVIESSGRQFHADITPDMHGRSEKRSFQQLVTILMDNAAKYCDDGGNVHVTLAPRSRRKGAMLTVSNTYVDGKDVDYSKFFERFYREDASHNSAKAGFGIGLSMGKEIAERLGGRLRVAYADEEISFVYEQ